MNRDEFLDIGTHCSDKSCNQLDFLPFKCPSCSNSFCGEHWRQTQHSCANYDPIKANNLIPSCPLCSIPVSFPPNSDPNIAMDVHLSTSCSILFPTLKPSSFGTPICSAKKCTTKMVVPINCKEGCKKSYCFKHRFAGDHNCIGIVKKPVSTGVVSNGKGKGVIGTGLRKVSSIGKTSSASASTSKLSPITKPSISKPKPKAPIVTKANSKSSNSQSTSASVAASAAEKRLLGSRSNPIIISDDDSDEEVKVLSGPRKALIALTPASKGDKRAIQERASAKRALEMRASRGLLTEDEKLKYAQDQAEEAQLLEEGKKSSCSMS